MNFSKHLPWRLLPLFQGRLTRTLNFTQSQATHKMTLLTTRGCCQLSPLCLVSPQNAANSPISAAIYSHRSHKSSHLTSPPPFASNSFAKCSASSRSRLLLPRLWSHSTSSTSNWLVAPLPPLPPYVLYLTSAASVLPLPMSYRITCRDSGRFYNNKTQWNVARQDMYSPSWCKVVT